MKTFLLTAILLLFGTLYADAQAGTLDTAFGNNGVVYCDKEFLLYASFSTTLDAQHRVLVAYHDYEDTISRLVRFLPDGALDPDFGDGGEVTADALIQSLLVLEDGNILAAGSIRNDSIDLLHENEFDFYVTRWRTDGSPDTTFGDHGRTIIDLGNNENVQRMILQPDGKILISGSSGHRAMWIMLVSDVVTMRLSANGLPDETFGNDGIVITDVTNTNTDWDGDVGGPIAVQPDGKIVVAAKHGPGYNEEGYLALLRYTANGAPDTTFGTGGIVITPGNTTFSNDILLKHDQSILLAGRNGSVFSGGFYPTLRQYTPEGKVDSSFASNGIYTLPMSDGLRAFTSMKMQPDQKIVVAGVNMLLMRFTPDGQPDPSFAQQVGGATPIPEWGDTDNQVYLFPDQKITTLSTGTVQNNTAQKLALIRYHNDISSATYALSRNAPSNVRVYPNPVTTGLFHVSFYNPIAEKLTVSLIHANGQVLTEWFTETPIQAGLQNIPLNLPAQLPPGLYYLRLQTDATATYVKVIKAASQ